MPIKLKHHRELGMRQTLTVDLFKRKVILAARKQRPI